MRGEVDRREELRRKMESRDVRRDEGRTKEDKMGEDTKMIKVEGK